MRNFLIYPLILSALGCELIQAPEDVGPATALGVSVLLESHRFAENPLFKLTSECGVNWSTRTIELEATTYDSNQNVVSSWKEMRLAIKEPRTKVYYIESRAQFERSNGMEGKKVLRKWLTPQFVYFDDGYGISRRAVRQQDSKRYEAEFGLMQQAISVVSGWQRIGDVGQTWGLGEQALVCELQTLGPSDWGDRFRQRGSALEANFRVDSERRTLNAKWSIEASQTLELKVVEKPSETTKVPDLPTEYIEVDARSPFDRVELDFEKMVSGQILNVQTSEEK